MKEYVTKDSGKRDEFNTGARRDTRVSKGRFDLIPPTALSRWAQLMERGAIKYGDRNYEKGMPFSRYLDSAMRHLVQFMNGETDEDHLSAVLFNVGAIMHHQDMIAKNKLPKDLDDINKSHTTNHRDVIKSDTAVS